MIEHLLQLETRYIVLCQLKQCHTGFAVDEIRFGSACRRRKVIKDLPSWISPLLVDILNSLKLQAPTGIYELRSNHFFYSNSLTRNTFLEHISLLKLYAHINKHTYIIYIDSNLSDKHIKFNNHKITNEQEIIELQNKVIKSENVSHFWSIFR